jgi:hypothetical protein
MKRNLLLTAVVMLGSVLSACAARGAYMVSYGPPPPPRYAVVGVAPGPGYVWTEGFYDLRPGGWVWIPGRWMVAPRPRAVWVPAYWSRHGSHHRFHEGRWR